MKRVLLVFLIVSLLCSNLGSAFAALPTEGDVKEEITSAEAVSQPYPNFKEGKETGDVIAQLLSDVSVADSVYSNKPRGKFIIRISSNHIVRDPTNALRHSTNNKFNDSSDVSENISESDLAYKLDYFKVNTFEALNSISMELNTDEVNYLLTNSLIESIEEDKLIEIAAGPLTTVAPQNIKDTSQTIPWGIHSTGAYIAQNQDLNGSLPIKIAVFDTGISSHPDLNLSGGISFVENDPTYNDNQGHGTHIAGTITASNNSFGVIGIVPDAELYSVKVMESDGIGYTSSVLSGIQWAIDNNINIINMSFVSSQYSEALHAAIRLATQSGIMIVAAAGNKGAGEPVEQLYSFDAEVFYVLQVDGKEIRTTSNHPFWVKDRGWVAADELAVGDQLETENLEYHAIESIDIEYNPSQVYNFTVDDYHTYYISEQGYLTHNLLDACRLDRYATVSPVLKTGKKGTPSEILEAEIKWATGIDKPSGWRAHHIVAERHSNEFADKARGILRTYGIDKNSSANGVHLPTDTGKVFTSIDGQTLATHNGGHSGDYFEYVYQVLKAGEEAEGKDGVLKALNDIISELLTGKLAIGKI